jgi:hypothetical protein
MDKNAIELHASSLTPALEEFLLSDYDYYELPFEIWEIILLYLNPIDLYNLMISNKKIFKIVLLSRNTIVKNLKKSHFLEEIFLLHMNFFYVYKLELLNRIKFIHIMNLYYSTHTHSEKFDYIYNNSNQIILADTINNIMYDNYNYYICLNHPVSLNETKIRFGILSTFYKGNIKLNGSVMAFIKYARSLTFYRLSSLIFIFPTIINYINIQNINRINDFFNTKWDTHKFIFNKLIDLINYAIFCNGKPDNTLKHIINDKIQLYVEPLMCGIKEKDADYYASSRKVILPELLLTFKALIPIVGYDYAKHFIIDRRINLDEYPYFLEVASKLNSNNCISFEKCSKFSKYGGDLDRVLSLRDKKRKFTE